MDKKVKAASRLVAKHAKAEAERKARLEAAVKEVIMCVYMKRVETIDAAGGFELREFEDIFGRVSWSCFRSATGEHIGAWFHSKDAGEVALSALADVEPEVVEVKPTEAEDGKEA